MKGIQRLLLISCTALALAPCATAGATLRGARAVIMVSADRQEEEKRGKSFVLGAARQGPDGGRSVVSLALFVLVSQDHVDLDDQNRAVEPSLRGKSVSALPAESGKVRQAIALCGVIDRWGSG